MTRIPLPLLALALVLLGTVEAAAQERRTVEACLVLETNDARAVGLDTAAAGPQVVLLEPSGVPAFSLNGVLEAELARYVGRRVAVTGTIERPRVVGIVTTVDESKPGSLDDDTNPPAGVPPAGATGITPAGAPAHEPGDARSATVPTDEIRVPGADGPGRSYDVTALPRLNAASYRVADGSCDEALRLARRPAPRPAPARAETAPPPRVPAAPARAAVTVTGCLVRQASDNGWHLVDAARADAASPLPASAVPGSSPSGFGSGTVGTTGAEARQSPPLAFILAADGDRERALAALAGTRVSISGMVDEDSGVAPMARRGVPEPNNAETTGRVEVAPSPAHPQPPTKTLTVESVRRAGTACP